jgi:hypothetical protein
LRAGRRLRDIGFNEADVVQPRRRSAHPRLGQGNPVTIHPHDFARRPDKKSHQHRDVADTRTHIEYSLANSYASLPEKSFGKGRKASSLAP